MDHTDVEATERLQKDGNQQDPAEQGAEAKE
jgi:hypothetical protein